MKCVLVLGVLVTSVVVGVVESRIVTQTWPQTEAGDGKGQLWKMFNFQQSFISMQNSLINLQEFVKSVDYNRLIEDVQLLKTDLNSANTELDNTKLEVDNTKAKLDNTENKLNNTKIELDNTNAKLDNAEQKLTHTETELREMKANLANMKTELDKTKTKLNFTEHGLSKTNSKLDNAEVELEKTKTKLRNTETELKKTKSELQTTAVSTDKTTRQIGFHVKLTSDTNIKSSADIVKPWTSHFNYNNSFDTATGQFTSPCDGLFFFIASSGSYESSKYGNLRLEVGDMGRLSETWVQKYSNYWSMGSCHAVVHLTKGQRVWLACGKSGGCYFDEESTSFSGFLVSADK